MNHRLYLDALQLWHHRLVHHAWRHILHSQFHHGCGLQSDDLTFVRGWQTLEQNHYNVFDSHGHLQTNELIRNCFDFVVAVQQVIVFLHLAHKELATNKDNVGQAPHIVDVAKNFLYIRWFSATSNVCKLVVRETKRNDGHCLLHT